MKRIVVTASAIAALAITGCGSSDNRPPSALQERADAVPSGALQVQSQFRHVVQAVSPSVVQIQSSRGLGSGVAFDDQGHIVTNAHVVAGSQRFVVTLPDGSSRKGTLVASAPSADIAVIEVSGASPQSARFGDSEQVAVGDLVLALGSPLGLRASVTQGIVSSTGRKLREPGGVELPSAIQTSAEINPGNSGGALVNLSGRVVGIPTLTATDPEFGNTPAPGIGFAISSNIVRKVATSLIASSRHATE